MYAYIHPRNEELIREIYGYACEHGVPVIKKYGGISAIHSNEKAAKEFYEAAHVGFGIAQEIISRNILELEESEEPDKERIIQVLRKLADSIGWQIIRRQLYVARRLYKDQSPPKLSESNFGSVYDTAKKMNSESSQKFYLISDLTSFVQVGDLLVSDPTSNALELIEVKEGKKNEEIINFMDFYEEAKCDRALHYFLEHLGKRGQKQFHRVLRQGRRMSHVADILTKDAGVDPDTDQKITIRKDPVESDLYDDHLVSLIEKASSKNWAIDVVEGCLFIGAYSGEFLPIADKIFTAWFRQSGGNQEDPICNINQAMNMPLAFPIFSRMIPPSSKFDVLFGRVTIFMALHLDNFIALSKKFDTPFRWGTRREAGMYLENAGKLKRNHKPLMATMGEKTMGLSDGILARIFFHGQTPMTIINAMRKALEDLPDEE